MSRAGKTYKFKKVNLDSPDYEFEQWSFAKKNKCGNDHKLSSGVGDGIGKGAVPPFP